MEDIEESVKDVDAADPQTDNDESGWENVDWNSLGDKPEEQEAEEQKPSQEVEEEVKQEVKEEKPERDLEKDSAFANMRRQLEEKEKELAKYKQADQEFANKFRDYGVTNVNEYLTKIAEEEQKQKNAELQEKLANGDMTVLNDIISNAVKQAVAPYEQEKARIQQEQAYKQLQSELSELNSQYNLDVKGIYDIKTLPNGDKIVEYMEKSLSASEAYFLANKDTVKQDIVKQTKQATINKVTGISHIKPNGVGSDVDEVQIPEDVMEGYRLFGYTVEEAKKDYKKQIKLQ